jgi:hypothetical protein
MFTPYLLPNNAKAGSIYLSKGLDTTKDIVVSFEYACYGSSASGAEGFCVFFNNTFSKFLSGGGPGPGLCYAPVFGVSAFTETGIKSIFDGVKEGQLGIGFDITGNYGMSGYGVDGLGMGIPNSITLRGSQNNLYTRLYTSNSLTTSGFSQPFTIYQQVTSVDDIQYIPVRIRLTNFCKKVLIDIIPPGKTEYTNYITQTLSENWPISVNCCLGFASGLFNTCFAIKNFNINGIFTSLSAENVQDQNFWTYCGEWYLGQIPNPATLTVQDTITIQNAPPWNNYPSLILVSPEGAAPFQNADNYINITYTGGDTCSIVYPGDEYIARVGTMPLTAQDRFRDFVTQLTGPTANNIWSKIVEGWIFAKDYNIGFGQTAYALKNTVNNGSLLYSSLTGISWANQGLRFHRTPTVSQLPLLPRVEISNWQQPSPSASFGIAVIASPLSAGRLPQSIFGRTSWGGGPGSHFGMNFNVGNSSRLDHYHGKDSIAGSVLWSSVNPLSTWWLQGMSTDGKTVSSFINGYNAVPANWTGTYNYQQGTELDRIWFGNAVSGFEYSGFDGIIQAGFVFSEPIDFNQFYQIYRNTIGQGLNFPSYP